MSQHFFGIQWLREQHAYSIGNPNISIDSLRVVARCHTGFAGHSS